MTYRELAQKMISGSITDESDLQITLDDDPGLLDSLRMKVAQQSCLIRYLNQSLPSKDRHIFSNVTHHLPPTFVLLMHL
jgi:hypothetical protein